MLKLKNYKLSNLLIINLTTCFLFFCCNSYALFLFILLLNCGLDLFVILEKHKLNAGQFTDIDKRCVRRISLFFLILAACVFAVVGRNAHELFNQFLPLTILYMAMSLILIGVGLFFAIKYKVFIFKISKNKVLEYLPILLISTAIILLSIDCFYTSPKYDSYEFFNALFQINIANLNNIGALKLCNHISVFYSILVYILSCLIGNLYYATILFNIICNIFIALSAYHLFKYISNSSGFSYLCAMLFGFSPFTLGFNGYIYLDTIMMYGVFFFLCCLIMKQEEDVLLLSSLLAIFSKEVGFLITAVLIFGPLILDWIRVVRKKKDKTELKKYFTIYYACMFIIHFAFVVFFLIKNWATDGGMVEYGLYIGHMGLVLVNLFITNFTWVLLAVIFIALIKYVKIKRKQNTQFADARIIKIICTVLVLTLMFNFVVITWNHIRYLSIEIMMIYLIFCLSMKYLFDKFKITYLFVPILSFLLIQNFFTIDPVMNLASQKIYLGTYNNYLVLSGYPGSDPINAQFSDCTAYNKQMNMFDIAFDKFLKAIDYDSSKCIISGPGAHENKFLIGSAWDKEKQKRYFTEDESEFINYFNIEYDEDLTKFFEYKEVYYINYNTGKNIESSKNPNKDVTFYIENNNNIVLETSFDVEFFGWRFTVSKLVKI